MTDGAGLINLAALITIKNKFGYDAVPATIQGRIGGLILSLEGFT
jgi:hypothetical protein